MSGFGTFKLLERLDRLWSGGGGEGGDGDRVVPAECKEHVEEDHRDIDEDDQGEKRFCRMEVERKFY